MSHRNDDDPRKRAAETLFGLFVLSLLVWSVVATFIDEYIDKGPIEKESSGYSCAR